MKEKDKIEIDVLQMLKVLWKRKLIIALAAIITGGIAFGYSSFVVKPSTSEASACSPSAVLL